MNDRNTDPATGKLTLELFRLENAAFIALERVILETLDESPEMPADEKELKSAVRATADFFREKFFGFSEKKVRQAINEVLEDYFDGETYRGIEMVNMVEQTGIKEEVLMPVVQKMIAQGVILVGRRRRWNEFGEHYFPLYRLTGEKSN